MWQDYFRLNYFRLICHNLSFAGTIQAAYGQIFCGLSSRFQLIADCKLLNKIHEIALWANPGLF